MIFYDYFVPPSLAKEMDEKRAAAAALGYSQSNVNHMDDRQLYGDSATPGLASPSTIAGLDTPQSPQSINGGPWQQHPPEDNEGQYDFVPHFQRVSIGGEQNSGVII